MRRLVVFLRDADIFFTGDLCIVQLNSPMFTASECQANMDLCVSTNGHATLTQAFVYLLFGSQALAPCVSSQV
jgi:hypothetical protein